MFLNNYYIKKLNSTFVLAFLLLYSINNYAQRGKHWYFADSAALRFDANSIMSLDNSVLSDPQLSLSCITMSDTSGNLLFYSNGIDVWNKQHQIMANGGSLSNVPNLGNRVGQAIAIPMPNNDSLYYLFYNHSVLSNYQYSLCYSIINMNRQNGLGEVIQRNIVLKDETNIGLTVILDNNKRDFWIVTKYLYSPIFYSFKLSDTGVTSQPIISDFSIFNPTIFLLGHSLMKASPNGKLIAMGKYIFFFNQNSGVLYSPRALGYNNISLGSFCFSPNSQRYYMESNGLKIIQYSLANLEATAYPFNYTDSSEIAYNETTQNFGNLRDMQIGNDNKIYAIRNNSTRLSCISKPNDSSYNCQFIDTAVLLTKGVGYIYLPSFISNINSPSLNINIQKNNCYNYSFTFNSILEGATYKQWSFGDNSFSNDSIATHIYSAIADSFLVRFSIVPIGGTDTLKMSRWVILPKKPIANFTTQTNGCIKDSVHFAGSFTQIGTAPVSNLYWSLGNGSFINQQQNFNYLYSDTGTYNIKFYVKDTMGCVSDTVVKTIAVNKKAIANFGLIAPYCNNIAVALKDSSLAYNTTTNLWKYFISNGDSIVSNINGNQSYHFTTAGNYTIKLLTKTNDGCLSDTASKTFTIYPKPIANFGLPQNCILDKTQFTDSSIAIAGNSITNWLWNFGDANATVLNSNTSTVQNATHQYTQATSYSIKLIVTTNRQCADTTIKTFVVNGALPNAVIAIPAQSFCSGDSLKLIDNSNVNFGSLTKLRWLINGVDSLVVSNPQQGNIYAKKLTAFGTPASRQIPIQLKVQSGINCISIKDSFVVLKAQPQVVFTTLNAVCQNIHPFTITAASEINNAAGKGWYSGLGVIDSSGLYNPTAVAANNSYKILFSFLTALGCSDTASQNITILDTPYVNAGADKVILEGGQTILNATATGSSNLLFLWQPNIALSSNTAMQPVAAPTVDITYKLIVTQNNTCQSWDTVHVQVLKSLIIPNAFSPNGDGKNEDWQIPNLSSYPLAKVFVYNRNGQLVFESTGYSKPWDGTCNGKPLPVGVYYYIIQLGNGINTYSGSVTILK
jgi:gliding motility-associated-like protein